MRVLLSLDRLFLGFVANGKVYYSFGELVHVARTRGAGFAHAREYGARRQPLQRRSGMPLAKLSHYRIGETESLPNFAVDRQVVRFIEELGAP